MGVTHVFVFDFRSMSHSPMAASMVSSSMPPNMVSSTISLMWIHK